MNIHEEIKKLSEISKDITRSHRNMKKIIKKLAKEQDKKDIVKKVIEWNDQNDVWDVYVVVNGVKIYLRSYENTSEGETDEIIEAKIRWHKCKKQFEVYLDKEDGEQHIGFYNNMTVAKDVVKAHKSN